MELKVIAFLAAMIWFVSPFSLWSLLSNLIGEIEMGFLAFVGAVAILAFLVKIALWALLDSDIELFLLSHFGKGIGHLRGKVVWITGASSGIGRHLALVLAKHGVKLALSARNLQELETVKQLCVGESGGSLTAADVFVMQMDMLDVKHHQKYFDAVIQHFGVLNVLVNNAGRSQRALWHKIDVQVDKDLFELNVFSVVNLTRVAINYWEANSMIGHVAVSSSVAGLFGLPGGASYTGAKHAIQGYFEALRSEMANIKVTLFCPGPTFSKFLEECFVETPGRKFGVAMNPEDRRMSTDRCAYLYAVALANQAELNWCGVFPWCLLVSVYRYCPYMKRLGLMLIGGERIFKIRDSK